MYFIKKYNIIEFRKLTVIFCLGDDGTMKLSDISHGPDWVTWVVFSVLTVLSIILLFGHGSWLIAGYNTASKEEKEKYDAKKLCRVTGIGILIISVLILIMGIFEDKLPASFAYIAIGIILIDCVIMIILSNKICKK